MFRECLEEVEPGTSDVCDGCPPEVKSKCQNAIFLAMLKVKAEIVSDGLPAFGD